MGCGKILQGKIRKGEEFLRTTTAWEDRSDKENENFLIIDKDRTKAVQIFVTRGLERLESRRQARATSSGSPAPRR